MGVYYLSDEERKEVLRGLLPRSRELGVTEELRGWNWFQPPLEPPFAVRPAMHEVANRYCPTARDLYLRRVCKVRVQPNSAMVAGSYLHGIAAAAILEAKRLIYSMGVARHREIIASLTAPPAAGSPGHQDVEDGLSGLSADDRAQLEGRAQVLREFQCMRVAARIEDVLARHPYIGEDSLVALAIPVVTEQRLDGSLLGLSRNLSSDALTFSEPMICDIKFGERRDFHRLSTTGYALVMESIHEYPVNIGCLVYVRFKGDRVFVERDFHVIDDELRQWFVEERDEKTRLIEEEIDPGVAGECPPHCSYAEHCKGTK